MARSDQKDEQLVAALTEAYTARAKLFHNGVKASRIDLLIAEIDTIDPSKVKWNLKALGITKSAFKRLNNSGARPHQVFAHPQIIRDRPRLIAYYRNLAAISRKGISQILFSTNKYENGRARNIDRKDADTLCVILSEILSGVIDSMSDYDIAVGRQAILAEIGSQLQGTWANYLASCFTDAVISQMRDEGQVRVWYNLTSILADETERRRFLSQIFHVVDEPT